MAIKKDLNVGIIGAGNMGAAIVAGIWSKFFVYVCETDKRKSQKLRRRYKVALTDLEGLMEVSDIIILAVKPQGFEDLLGRMKPFMGRQKLVVSIAAGITTRYIEKRLGGKVRVVRAMPNLPVQVQQGITGICQGAQATRQDIARVKGIFGCIGEVLQVEEKMIDAVTAVSGSGPAYFFLFVEQYMQAARKVGFSNEVARQLVLKTIEGSLHLLMDSRQDPQELREKVTSKGGTTFAALEILMAQDVRYDKVFIDALKAARKRAKELSR